MSKSGLSGMSTAAGLVACVALLLGGCGGSDQTASSDSEKSEKSDREKNYENFKADYPDIPAAASFSEYLTSTRLLCQKLRDAEPEDIAAIGLQLADAGLSGSEASLVGEVMGRMVDAECPEVGLDSLQ